MSKKNNVLVEETIDEKFTNEVEVQKEPQIVFVESEYTGEAEVTHTYIKRSIKGYYVGFPCELNKESYGDNIGTTYYDFLDNKWVLLSDEQLTFHNEHPEASVKEVLDMELFPKPEEHIRTIDEAKQEKLREIEVYNRSENVDSFTINGEITSWFTPTERSNYKNSIESAKVLEVKELSLFINGTLMTIPTETAEKLLAAIQLYADACYIVTQQHKNIVEAMTEIDDVDNYDYTVGYPERLNFTI